MKKTALLLIVFFTTVFVFADEKNPTALERIKSSGTFTIGVEGTYPPYTFHEKSGALTGYDVEVARAIADKLGVKTKFVESKWDSLIIGLDSGLWDVVINQVGISPERKKKYDFSIPYTYTRGALVVRDDNAVITSFKALKGKKSAQSVTSNWARVAEKFGAELVGTDGFNQSVDLVISGRADSTINDDVTFYDYKKQHPQSKTKIAALSDEITETAVILPKKQADLLKAINAALGQLRSDGTLSALSQKYFGTDISKK